MRILIITLLSIVIYGCETTTVQPDAPLVPDKQAMDLFDSGDFLSAGQEYLSLSANDPDNAVQYKLRAVYSFIKAMDYEKASATLNSITDAYENDLHSILKAKIQLEDGKPDLALNTTKDITLDNLGLDLITLLYESRAKAYERLEQNYNAAKELIVLDNLLVNSGAGAGHTRNIWNYLITDDLENNNDLGDLSENNLIAWIELANITRALITQNSEFKDTLGVWSQLNPSHPANSELISELLSISENFDSRPDQIALLLPLTGIYERYSEKIREGFLTAWFNEQSYRPLIKIYNTDRNDIQNIYHQAVSEGAEFVVGPLDKEAVGRLLEMDSIPVRTLALNQVDNSDNGLKSDTLVPLHQFVQFGLPPEDEARQVAQRGIFEGYNRALVVTSNDEFGTRVFNAFSNEWVEMGGKVLEKVEYDSRTSDFVTPIKRLLNIDSSEQRFSNLRQKLGRNLLYNSRLREDAEFIFVVATNLTARQIVPHLRFFRAEGVPIFTTSSVYTGNKNPQIDSDLNGVEFVEIPWLLRDTNNQNSLVSQIKNNWAQDSSLFPRYYAFGVDAFRLIYHSGNLMLKPSNKYQGETGQLHITPEGKVRRNLIWAKFDNGIPVPLNPGSIP